MLQWLRNYRRRRVQARPFPASWPDIVSRNARFRARLDPELQRKLDQAIQVLVHEKNWEGCGGLSLGDEHRVTIAAHAARLTLGFDGDFFDDLRSVLIYPSAYEAPSRDILGPGVVVEGLSGRVGEAWNRGPVILAWSDVLHSTRQPHMGRNVVLHEFAHILDLRNGRVADGIPVIESFDEANEWLDVTKLDYQRLCDDCRHRRSSVMDCYGTTNEAEFFAVATEAFFESPRKMVSEWPDLFRILRRFYRQNPI